MAVGRNPTATTAALMADDRPIRITCSYRAASGGAPRQPGGLGDQQPGASQSSPVHCIRPTRPMLWDRAACRTARLPGRTSSGDSAPTSVEARCRQNRGSRRGRGCSLRPTSERRPNTGLSGVQCGPIRFLRRTYVRLSSLTTSQVGYARPAFQPRSEWHGED